MATALIISEIERSRTRFGLTAGVMISGEVVCFVGPSFTSSAVMRAKAEESYALQVLKGLVFMVPFTDWSMVVLVFSPP